MRIVNQSNEIVSVNALKPHPRNPRQGDVEVIAESIDVNGFYGAVVAQRSTGFILAGNHRFLAAKQTGATKIPIIWVDCSDEEAQRILLADNRTSDLADYDDQALADLLKELAKSDSGLLGTGYGDEDLDKLLTGLDEDLAAAGLTDPDDIPEPPPEPVTKPGDLWVLGDHRLLCGDSTKSEDVQRVMAGERAILFATDPPYLVDYDGTNHPHRWDKPDNNKDWSDTYGDNWDESGQGPELYDGFLVAALAEAIEPNAAWYCWHASRRQAMVEGVWNKHGAFVHQQIVWVKSRPILTRSWYLWQHEPCFMGWVKGHKPPKTTEEFLRTVWELDRPLDDLAMKHPTAKPVEVFAIPIRQHTRKGEVCYEPFAGSGTQIIAAEQLGRRCNAIEISPVYCDVVVERWQAFTGKKANRS